MTTLVQTLLVPVVTIAGLVVLIALGDVTAAVGVPIIAGLAGVHSGAQLVTNAAPTPTPAPAPIAPPAA